ncbi:MAG: hypothetical protein NC432_02305 [Roseburia sp.]|nr:hypothetical protein [Roseburia sp.]MCM1097476.1 hypothetical protein [Ruminococcus flavefaciens]
MAENKRKKSAGKNKATGGFSGLRKLLASPKVTVVMFGLAVILLLGSSIGGARAALTYTSQYYNSRVQMYNIGVSLCEQSGNHEPRRVSWRNYDADKAEYWDEDELRDEADNSLLTDLLEPGEEFQVGRSYPERLYVENTGVIDQYVRVTLYKYWVVTERDAEGNYLRDSEGNVIRTKRPELSPALIDLHLINCGGSGEGKPWIVDEGSSTRERTVLYYRDILKAPGEGVAPEETVTADLTDYLRIDSSAADAVYQTTEKTGAYTTITTTYVYDGIEFRIKAQVDAVQTHSPQDAIWSAWGREVELDENGSLISVK